MIFDPNSIEYQKWCVAMGISPNCMHQVANDNLFKCLNSLMEKPELVEDDEPNFASFSDDELRQYIDDNGGTYHHMNKRDKLVEIAGSI